MASKPVKRPASPEHITKLWKQGKTPTPIATRIGYSLEGVYRALNRLGLRNYTR